MNTNESILPKKQIWMLWNSVEGLLLGDICKKKLHSISVFSKNHCLKHKHGWKLWKQIPETKNQLMLIVLFRTLLYTMQPIVVTLVLQSFWWIIWVTSLQGINGRWNLSQIAAICPLSFLSEFQQIDFYFINDVF